MDQHPHLLHDPLAWLVLDFIPPNDRPERLPADIVAWLRDRYGDPTRAPVVDDRERLAFDLGDVVLEIVWSVSERRAVECCAQWKQRQPACSNPRDLGGFAAVGSGSFPFVGHPTLLNPSFAAAFAIAKRRAVRAYEADYNRRRLATCRGCVPPCSCVVNAVAPPNVNDGHTALREIPGFFGLPSIVLWGDAWASMGQAHHARCA